jgi:site-specific DNA-methyltransferase (cytosine-N4-specific)
VEEVGFHLAQECFWYNPAKMPVPAEWVTVRKIRIKESVEYLWWLSKTPWPKASNQRVLTDGLSRDMQRLAKKGLKATTRPGGYKINPSWATSVAKGAIPSNFVQAKLFPDDFKFPEDVLIAGNNSANDAYTLRCKEAGVPIHPARFPAAIPNFFVRLLTEPNDVVLDPFAGSNTTGAVAEALDRRWIAFDDVEDYLKGSRFRFGP